MIYTSFILTLVICFVLILYHWKQNKPIVLFVYVLLTIGQRSLIYLLLESGTDPELLAYLYIHNIPFSLMLGPTLYFYSLSVIHGHLYLNRWIWFATLPSLIAIISLQPYFQIPIADKIQVFSSTHPIGVDSEFFKGASRWIPIKIFQNITVILNSAYFYFCIYLLLRARKQANKVIKKRINNILGVMGIITLMTYLPAILVYIFVYSDSNFMLNANIKMNYSPTLRYLSIFILFTPVLIFLFPNWIYANQVNANQQSYWDKLLMKFLDKPILAEEKPNVTSIDDDDLERIMYYLKDEKKYLIPSLSIHEISRSLDIPQARVTYYFNKVIKVPFPRLRNQLRIEHAIGLLNQNAHLSLSIEGIAMQSGFKNKSTFYIAFKDEKGMTPMDWLSKQGG